MGTVSSSDLKVCDLQVPGHLLNRWVLQKEKMKKRTVVSGMRKFGGQLLTGHLCQLSAFFWFLAAEGTAVCWQVGTCSGGGCWAGRAVASGAVSARLAVSLRWPHPALRTLCAPVAGVTKRVDFGGQIVAPFLMSGCDLGKLLNLLWFS